MAAPLKRPQTQKPLTNVAVVRYKHKNKRSVVGLSQLVCAVIKHSKNTACLIAFSFEIACYKNKVISWRKGAEKDLSEVLQTETIFRNVQRGIEAPARDLKQAFKTTNERDICRMILQKGQLQVSKKERKDGLDAKFKEIATIIYDKCVNRETKKPFPVSVIENAMRDMSKLATNNFQIKMNKSSKVQANELLVILKDNDMPI